MGVINLDNTYGSSGIWPFHCCCGGVQEFKFCSEVLRQAVPKLKRGEITPLQDLTIEHFELRAGSGL